MLKSDEAQIILANSNVRANSTPAELHIKLLNSSGSPDMFGENALPGKSNYFLGNDPSKWHMNVPRYAKVRYGNVYPGIDLVYHGHQREVEYDFIIRPGADPRSIRMAVEGAESTRLDNDDIVLTSSKAGEVHLRRPVVYQEKQGKRTPIPAKYHLWNSQEVSFEVAAYDRTRPLIIDPVVAYSSFTDPAYGIALNSLGEAYLVAQSTRNSPPFTRIVSLTKLNADGTAALYTVYLGGTIDEWRPSVALDRAGNVYVTGATQSLDFPLKNALQSSNHGCYDAFITKLKADTGALLYSTYFGGANCDYGFGITVDSGNRAYVAGVTGSTDLPTVNALQPSSPGGGDGFLAKINAAGNSLVYATYLGGGGLDGATGVATDLAGNAYVIGSTGSTDFPIVNALQPQFHGGGFDLFLSKINPTGSAFIYSTFLGGSGEELGGAIALDSSNNVYISGSTTSADYPTTGALQSMNKGNFDAFVTKINRQGSAIIYSTYLGGSDNDFADGWQFTPGGLAVDSSRSAYVVGYTQSNDFPTVNPIQGATRGLQDAFVAKLAPDGHSLVYSTYLGGSGNDQGTGVAANSLGAAYVIGLNVSADFPTTPAAYHPGYGGGFLTKIAPETFVTTNPGRWNFATQVVGTSSAAKKTALKNTGATPLTINQIYVAGTAATDFSETNNCPPVLAANQTCNVFVKFAPTKPGIREGALIVSDSDPASPQAVKLFATGTVVSLLPVGLSFASQSVGTTSAAQTIAVTNLGTVPLQFTNQRVGITGLDAGDFGQTTSCGTVLAAGASCQIFVTFTPSATGSRQATVVVSDTGGGSPQKVMLTGSGS